MVSARRFAAGVDPEPRNPGDGMLLYTVHQRMGDFDKVLDVMRGGVGVAAAPDDPMAYKHNGVALARRGGTGKAMDVLRKGLAMSPDNSRLLRNLAVEYARPGNVHEAEKHLVKAPARNPGDAAHHFDYGCFPGDHGRLKGPGYHYEQAARLGVRGLGGIL